MGFDCLPGLCARCSCFSLPRPTLTRFVSLLAKPGKVTTKSRRPHENDNNPGLSHLERLPPPGDSGHVRGPDGWYCGHDLRAACCRYCPVNSGLCHRRVGFHRCDPGRSLPESPPPRVQGRCCSANLVPRVSKTI